MHIPDSPRKEEAEVAAVNLVGLCVSAVICNVTARDRRGLRQVLVFAVAARPLVVPYIEDSTRLWRRLGFHRRRIDLCSRGALLPANDLLDLLLCGNRRLVICGRKSIRSLFSLRLLGRHSWRRVCLGVGHGIECLAVI